MAYTAEELLDFSTFAQYGSNIDKEINAEVFTHVLTQQKSVPYFRDMGSLEPDNENRPNTLLRRIQSAIGIIQSVQAYNDNLTTSDERRAIIPFDQINFDNTGTQKGERNLFFNYYPIRNFKNSVRVNL